MDPALKQRMLGAAVLVVLAIIFVPMLLDRSPAQRQESLELPIPERPGEVLSTRELPLDPQAPAPAAADPDHVATVDLETAPRVDALDEPAAAPQPDASPSPAPDVTATPAPVTPAPAATPAPTAPASPPATVPGGRWFVSFGSYGQRANADRLVASLAQAGVTAVAENVLVAGKTLVRVRAGPYVDRGEAERARLLADRAKVGARGTLVALDDTPATDAPALPAGSTRVTGWAVQVGAFRDRGDADALAAKIVAAGYAGFVDPVPAPQGTLYRVRVGPEAQRAGAERVRGELRGKLSLDGLLVTHP